MGGGRARLGGRGQLSPLQQEALPSTRKRQCSAESPQPSQGSSTPAALAGPWLCDTPGRGSQQPAKAPLGGTESHARKGGHSHWRDIHSDARAWSTRWRPPSTLPLATATAPPAVGGPKPNNPPAEEPALRQQQVPVPHCSSPQVCPPTARQVATSSTIPGTQACIYSSSQACRTPVEQIPPVSSVRLPDRHSSRPCAGLSPGCCPRASPGSVETKFPATVQAGWAGHAMDRILRRCRNFGRKMSCRPWGSQPMLPARPGHGSWGRHGSTHRPGCFCLQGA